MQGTVSSSTLGTSYNNEVIALELFNALNSTFINSSWTCITHKALFESMQFMAMLMFLHTHILRQKECDETDVKAAGITSDGSLSNMRSEMSCQNFLMNVQRNKFKRAKKKQGCLTRLAFCLLQKTPIGATVFVFFLNV